MHKDETENMVGGVSSWLLDPVLAKHFSWPGHLAEDRLVSDGDSLTPLVTLTPGHQFVHE